MYKILNNKLPMIITIVGNSGTGKTTIAKWMEMANIFPMITSYTTRPMREDETDGIDHWFVSEKEMPDRKEMLAYTYFANNHYWASLTDIEKDIDQPIVYIIDEAGLIDLFELERDMKINVIWVQINRNDTSEIDKERTDRDSVRESAKYTLQEMGCSPHIIINNNSTIESACFETAYKLMDFIEKSGWEILPTNEYNYQKLLQDADKIINKYID